MALRTNELGQPIGEDVLHDMPTGPPDLSSITGRWCSIGPLRRIEHGASLHQNFVAADDDREWTYLPYGPFRTLPEFDRWLELADGSTDPAFFTIDDGDGPCGIASYLRFAPSAGSVEVGHIHFAPRLQRTPAATEAMFLMMRGVFDAGYRRYEWKCDALNAGSRSAATRLGFSFEGVFRQATTYKGRNRDTAWFSIIDSEWPRLRGEFERWLDPANFDDAGQQLTRLQHTDD